MANVRSVRKGVTRTYVDGNTVRKSAYTQYEIPEYQNGQQRRRNINIKKNREKALHMDIPYVLALTIASVATLFICVNYLHVQSSITTRIHNIEALEAKLEGLKSENDALETRINTYVDLDHVFKVATQDLGMVYANKNQVLMYKKTESEYVRQHDDIPKH